MSELESKRPRIDDEQDVINVDLQQMSCDISTEKWLSFNLSTSRVISLSNVDKNALCEGAMQSDKHINFATCLLKMQFPLMEALESTLHQQKKVSNTSSRICCGIQVIYSRGNQWISASSVNCKEDEVVVYDSLYDSIDADTLGIIHNKFLFSSVANANV